MITHPDDTKSPGLFAYLRGLQSSDDERRKVVARVFFRPSISADSQLIAFTSDATLLENDQNRTDDVFVYQLDQAELLPSRDQRCFPETGQCMAEDFARYWEAQGGLPVFGYPIAPATGEQNRDLKTLYLTQWFERNRFEQHQENQPPYRVLLGRLGDERLRQLGRDWQQEPRAAGPQIGCLWFEATRHNVCNQGNGSEGPLGFLRYWRDHGLEFDGQPGASYEESLALFGLPLSEPSLETNSSGDTVLTQWFERARFEWHPGKPDEYKVLLFPLSSFLFPLFSFLFSLSSFLFSLVY